ncbi:hypothetical protein MK801_04050 [Lactococcus lactis]|uniref:hypothetical protein n=1 Tax=Lactococcus lactis TaxID=1358 RepID=UPI0020B7A76F|nr:hypothetical protein MK801_04050 [Lactococcus lactis]
MKLSAKANKNVIRSVGYTSKQVTARTSGLLLVDFKARSSVLNGLRGLPFDSM